MIKSRLPILLAERNLKITKVSNDTGISRTTLTSLSTDSSQGIQFDTLNKLCNYLKVTPGELFLYIPFDIEVSDFDNKKYDDEQGNIFFTLRIKNNNNEIDCDFSAHIIISMNQIYVGYEVGRYLDEELQEKQEKKFNDIKKFLFALPIQFLNDINKEIQDQILSNYFEDPFDDGKNRVFSFDWSEIL